MDIRTRVIAARLAVRIEENNAYSGRIGIKDVSHYKKPERGKENPC